MTPRIFGVDYQLGVLAMTTAEVGAVRSTGGDLCRTGLWRCGDRALEVPAATKAPVQCAPTQAGSVTPILLTKRDAVQCKDFRSRSVAMLFSICRPLAIVRLIALVIVDALKCQTLWALAHVAYEVLKMKPSVTDGDASTAVVSEGVMCRSVAACEHRSPYHVLARFSASVSSHLSLPFLLTISAHVHSLLAACRAETAPRLLQKRALAIWCFTDAQSFHLFFNRACDGFDQFLGEAGSEIGHRETITQVAI